MVCKGVVVIAFVILLLILIIVLGTLCGMLLFRYRSLRLIVQDVRGPLAETAASLGHGISSFASGDLRNHIESASSPAVTEDGKTLLSLLLSGVGDFNSITNVPSRRICFSGANSYQEGSVAGREIAGILGGKGKVACIIPSFNQVNHVLRMKGCFDYLSAKHPLIVLTGVFEGAGNRDATAVTCAEMLASHPEINLVYITDGHTPVAAAEVVGKVNRGIKMVVFDAMPENIDLLKSGRVSCLIEQNSYAQAWNALVYLYNSCETSWRPVTPKFFMEPITITMKNYQTYWDDAKNCRIMKDDEKTQLAVPAKNTSGKKYRIGLILPLSTGFFEGLGRGADAAREALKPYGVSVEVLDVFEDWNNFGSVKLFGPAIDTFIKEKYNGFATVVVDPSVVKEINKAVSLGMKVTTFNTEPSNFREIILSIMDNIALLSRESQELAAAAEQSSRANEQIGGAILGIRDDIQRGERQDQRERRRTENAYRKNYRRAGFACPLFVSRRQDVRRVDARGEVHGRDLERHPISEERDRFHRD